MATVFIYFEHADKAAAARARRLIVEGREITIDKRYSARYDRGHVPGMQDHIHVQLKGTDVCIVNRDGTPSHNTNPADAPRYVLDTLRHKKWITEARLLKTFGLPTSVVKVAIERYRFGVLLRKLRRMVLSSPKKKKPRK